MRKSYDIFYQNQIAPIRRKMHEKAHAAKAIKALL